MSAAPTPALADEREAFEKWYLRDHFDVKTSAASLAWAAWQTRASLPAPRIEGEAVWVQRLRETAEHLRKNSLSLAKYPDMADEARARELAALYIGEIAETYVAIAAFASSAESVSAPLPVQGQDEQAKNAARYEWLCKHEFCDGLKDYFGVSTPVEMSALIDAALRSSSAPTTKGQQ